MDRGLRSAWPLVGLALAAFVAAGCGGTPAGAGSPSRSTTPEPGGTGRPPASTTSTTTSSSVFGSRPAELVLDGVNPCLLWTEAQLGQLGVRGTPDDGDPAPGVLGNLTCNYRGPAEPVEIQYTASVSTQHDIADLLGTTAARTTETVTEVGGFPAIQFARPAGSIDPCSVVIGTASGQHLWIDLSVFPNEGLTVQQACQLTMKAATMAMDTLRTLR